MSAAAVRAVSRAAADRARADLAYRSAVLGAVAALEANGVRDPFARVATAAGVSRQAVRDLVTRSRVDV